MSTVQRIFRIGTLTEEPSDVRARIATIRVDPLAGLHGSARHLDTLLVAHGGQHFMFGCVGLP